jgi:UDP-N-acetylglucosamine--N-acetylmuramyl-(pentapeptide) pyrophosphoryl-undecaprenol N-acetylglucosamine transferase
MTRRVVIAGGGTAGHVLPGLAVARILRERGHEVSFVGTEQGLEARLVMEAGFPYRPVPARPFVRKISWDAMKAPLVALRSVARARQAIRGMDVLVGMGGYVSVPAVLAARRERVPAVLHEQNAVPGLANRVLARLARAVALSFQDARKFFPRRTRIVLTGNPVRPEILRLIEDRDVLAKEANEVLELEDGRRTIVIFGGSQGALHIDRAAVGACSLLQTRADLQVVLITGPAHLEAIRRGVPPFNGGLLARLLGYLDRMELAYACADLVVCRSGAMTIAEITACGLPSLQVPYPYATHGHQEANARALQRFGAAAVLLDDQLTSESLASRIDGLIDHPERLEAMAERARLFGRPDAGPRLADLVEEVART